MISIEKIGTAAKDGKEYSVNMENGLAVVRDPKKDYEKVTHSDTMDGLEKGGFKITKLEKPEIVKIEGSEKSDVRRAPEDKPEGATVAGQADSERPEDPDEPEQEGEGEQEGAANG